MLQLIIDGNASRQVETESRRLGLASSHVHDGVQEFAVYKETGHPSTLHCGQCSLREEVV